MVPARPDLARAVAKPWPPGDHYDVTEGKRRQAIAAGAIELDRDGFVALMWKRRDAWAGAGVSDPPGAEDAE